MILYHLIFVIFFFAFEIESGKIQPNFDEIFGKEWDKIESEEEMKIKQKERNENSAVDQMGGEFGNGPNDQIQNYETIKYYQNMKMEPYDEKKRETIRKFEAIKEKLREKGKYQWKDNSKIETKIGKLLGANRQKIYKWKKELNLNKNKIKKQFYDEKKREFIERFGEFKELYGQGKQKEFVKELGIEERLFRRWKKELLPKYHTTQNIYSDEDKLQKMKQYFKIKERNPKIVDEKIAEKLGIGSRTLNRWKKKFSPILTI